MVLDFVFIFIIVTAVLLGYRKGMTAMLLSCAVFLFSILIAMSIYNHVSQQFFESEYGKEMCASVSSGISEYLEEMEDTALENAPYLALMGIGSDSSEKNSGIEDLSDQLAAKAIKALLTVPLLILSFILLKILIFLARAILRGATRLPIIHGIDALLGSVCGLLMGIICMSLTYILVSYIQFIPSLEFIKEQFASSLIVLLINDFIF